MKLWIFALLLALAGCSTTVPVTGKFPDAPTILQEPCAELQKLNNGPQLSDVAKTITINYTSYYECATKVDAWTKWYNTQKIIFESTR